MHVQNPPKAWIILVGIAAVTVLMALGRVSSEAGLPVITAFVGYAVGNGIAARRGDTVDPIFGPSDER
jgi:hypothetical protein